MSNMHDESLKYAIERTKDVKFPVTLSEDLFRMFLKMAFTEGWVSGGLDLLRSQMKSDYMEVINDKNITRN